MLVLTRKQHQQIQIGDNITVTILKIKGNTVSVGIQAPEGVRILRSELTANAGPERDGERSAQPVASAPHKESTSEVAAESDATDALIEDALRRSRRRTAAAGVASPHEFSKPLPPIQLATWRTERLPAK